MTAPDLSSTFPVSVDERESGTRPAAESLGADSLGHERMSFEPWSLRTSSSEAHGSALLVDDDPMELRAMARVLSSCGYEVHTATGGAEAIDALTRRTFDVVLSDIGMPGMDGIELLREVRKHDLYVPVVLVTGEPAVSTAIKALEYGAFHYLTKPASNDEFTTIVQRAVQLHRAARVREQAAELLGHFGARAADRAGLEASFHGALSTLWMAYHPIVCPRSRTTYGYEALLRSSEPTLPHPGAVIDAAERLDAMQLLGRTIRERAAAPIHDGSTDAMLFVNLHVQDLLDPTLTDPSSPLARVADRVILEITERSSLDEVKDVRVRVARLRDMGFRIAVDDLGAGYAGLTSFALLEPEVVKLDMTLIRDVHRSPTKQKVIRSICGLCKDMGMLVVAEGVEVADERDVLIELGCDLLQGFLFARPGRPFPEVQW